MLNSALGWIGQLVEWFGRFVPRWHLVAATERAVKFLPGGKTKEVGPGIRWFWPVTTVMQVIPVVRQVQSVRPQTLLTADGKSVFVSGVVVFRINDLHKFMVKNYETRDNIDEIASAAIRKVIISLSFEAIQNGRGTLDRDLRAEARRALRSYGVLVESCSLVDFSTATVQNLVGQGLVNFNTSSQ